MTRLVCPKLLRRLFPSGSRVAIATSGGPDSQALLHTLATERQNLAIELLAVGIDHGLRSSAAAELDHAEALATRLDVPFIRTRVCVNEQGNLMANARSARHRALAAQARRHDATHLALGHTATDVAETVLMNLARGSSLRGAAALPIRRGRIVRPLLNATRGEVREYCVEHRIAFADDPTNDDLSFRRPLLRHSVLPALRAVSKDAERSIVRFARDARAAEDALTKQATAFVERHRIQYGPWKQAPVALPLQALREIDSTLKRYVIRSFLEACGVRINRRRLNRVLGAFERDDFSVRWSAPGSGADSAQAPNPCVALGIDRGHLFAVRNPDFAGRLADGWVLPAWGARFAVQERTHVSNDALPNAAVGVAFDAERLHHPLVVRPWARGDVIRCFGHGGRSKVGDLFTNAKIPKPLRKSWPIVTHGEEIVWIPGLRRSDFAPITEATRLTQIIHLDAALMDSAY